MNGTERPAPNLGESEGRHASGETAKHRGWLDFDTRLGLANTLRRRDGWSFNPTSAIAVVCLGVGAVGGGIGELLAAHASSAARWLGLLAVLGGVLLLVSGALRLWPTPLARPWWNASAARRAARLAIFHFWWIALVVTFTILVVARFAGALR